MTATPRTQALWMKHHAFSTEEEASEALCDFRDHGNALETELAAAQAECNRLYESSPTALDALTADLTRLRADNLTAHQMACAAGLERDQLRAEVEALKQSIESGQRVLREDAERNAARAERAEAALAEWSVLNLWGGTPEIIHEFIKGQQDRIHYCQDLETELNAMKAEFEKIILLAAQAADRIVELRRLAEKAEAEVANAVDGVIDGGSIPDTLLVIHIPRSPVGYRVGQPVKVILPAIDAAMKP